MVSAVRRVAGACLIAGGAVFALVLTVNGQSKIACDPDNEPLDVRFRREGDCFHYAGSYRERLRTPGRDVEHCFDGSITVSCLRLG